LREQNPETSESLSGADLDKPTKAAPQGREREFATYVAIASYTGAAPERIIAANVTDARRASCVHALAARAAI